MIEHVWNDLQDSVLKSPKPKTREELIARIQEEWQSITTDHLKKLVHSFPKRVEQCINNEGGHADY